MWHVLPMWRSAEIQGSFHVCSMPRAHTGPAAAVPAQGAGPANERRTAMKRSFRAATLFTGAAACAVALGPAAHAAPVAPGATARITPDITGGNCSPPTVIDSSVHLYYEASQKHPVPACFNGSGTWTLGKGKRFASYCAGAFSGYLYIDGTPRKFTDGIHNLYGASVSKVRISKYAHAGTACPARVIIM